MSEQTKQCYTCKRIKPASEFWRKKKNKDGLDYHCKECAKAYFLPKRSSPHQRARAKARYDALQACPEYRAKRKEYSARRYRDNKREFQSRYLLNTLGISLEQFEGMEEIQGGVCALCEKPESKKGFRLAVDHCHESGDIRGILCSGCNTSIGRLGDTAELLRRAEGYLRNPPYGKISCA